jgi:membrane protein YqaA with SNARE-associated domain
MIVVALASWLFDLSLGSLLLAWFAATTIGAVIGGCVGAFMGYLTAAFVLRRASTDEVDLEA